MPAPKIMIPTDFCPNNKHSTKLLLDLENLLIRTQDDCELSPPDEMNMYLQFDLVLSDVSAFLVDGDYRWSETALNRSAGSAQLNVVSFLPVIDKCGVILKLQQVAVAHSIGHVAAMVSMSIVAISLTHIVRSDEPAFSVLVS
ncbi:hypothetical protein F0562_017469 [Nyssa sinensis]|uniref:Sugar phosphate transporter domain-containing protein n=1 Tax=Nyssa sinensis TaxID=561372 RepID=A0A5J4ZHQ7_9ASTE|nr:hypothetical protein F0562_017469 [Nyssa sinensis]